MFSRNVCNNSEFIDHLYLIEKLAKMIYHTEHHKNKKYTSIDIKNIVKNRSFQRILHTKLENYINISRNKKTKIRFSVHIESNSKIFKQIH